MPSRQGLKAGLQVNLTGKVVIVTGANTGLGYEAAKAFALMNPQKLIMACRSESKGQAALNRLKEETSYQGAQLWLLDQSSFASVSAFATKFDQEVDRLDILVENAGIATADKVHSITQDGWEEGLQINNLAPELLTLLLLPKLFKTKQDNNVVPRVVIVSSSVHEGASIPEEAVNSGNIHQELSSKVYLDTKPASQKTYRLQKMLNVFFARALHKRLPPSSIIVATANPGYCRSELLRYFGPKERAVYTPFDNSAYTSEQGARHIMWPALAHPGEQTLAGAYTSIMQIRPEGSFVRSTTGAVAEKKLWDEAIEILSQVDTRVPDIVSKYLVHAV